MRSKTLVFMEVGKEINQLAAKPLLIKAQLFKALLA